MGKEPELTRDGYRCDEQYRAKVPFLKVNGQRLNVGDTFYPTPDMVLGALLSSLFVGKVRKRKPPVSKESE